MSSTPAETVDVDLGGRTVAVRKGGLYDRYRPNFYYRVSTARLTMLARSNAIRTRLPEDLAPLEIGPGLGLISVMFFRYDICDIDFYTEAAVAVAVRPARHGKLPFVDLIAGLDDDHLHAHVLSLPVNTDIAEVRGHDGYGFPKWRTDIDVDIKATHTFAGVANRDGGTDLSLAAPTPRQHRYRSGERVSSLTSYTLIDNAWPLHLVPDQHPGRRQRAAAAQRRSEAGQRPVDR